MSQWKRYASRGAALVTEDRKRTGLVLDLSVAQNLALSSLRARTRYGFIDEAAEHEALVRAAQDTRVRGAGLVQPVRTLSGGNQQKVVFGKALLSHPRLLLLDEPTRGVDIGAKAELYQLIDQLARHGMSVIVVSSELPELLGLADRVLVLAEGRLSASFSREEANQERVLQAALGKSEPPPESKSGVARALMSSELW